MSKKLIIWDFDGVISDTEKLWVENRRRMLNEKFGLNWDFATANRYLGGRSDKTKKEELDERLASVIIQFKARPGQIVLMADPQAPAGEMIYLVDAVRQHGGEKLHVATSPRGEK